MEKHEVIISGTENRNFLRELIESNVTKKLIPKGLGAWEDYRFLHL